MATVKLLDLVNESLGRSTLMNRVEKVNKYIAQIKQDDIYAVEPDSTWEEAYEFEPVRLSDRFIYFKYREPYNHNKEIEDRFNLKDSSHEDDIRYMLGWILRSIKKGYREAHLPTPKL